jgi:hypothetical protein
MEDIMDNKNGAERKGRIRNARIIRWLFAGLLILLIMGYADYNGGIKASAEGSYGTLFDTGTTGSLIWTVYDSDSDGIEDLLVISGTGPMLNFSNSTREEYSYYSGSIKNIIIENGLTAIGNYAFEGFSELTSVTLPDSVISIGEYAFANDGKLADIVLGEASQLQEIRRNAFYLCSSFADQDIFRTKYLQSIGGNAFWISGFNNTIVALPTSLISYDTTALGNQIKLTLFYPSNLDITFYGGWAALGYAIESGEVKITKLYSASTTATITLPETILGFPIVAITADRGSRTIVDTKHHIVDHVCQLCGYAQRCGDNIFYEYTDGVLTLFGSGAMTDYAYSYQVPWKSSMTGITKVVIPKGITSIGKNAFYGAFNLTDIEMEDGSGLTMVQPYAFQGCTSLSDKDIFIRARLQIIGSYAFSQTAYSGAIVLPSTLTSIDQNSFSMTTTALILPAGPSDLSGVGAYMGYIITNNEATITTFKSFNPASISSVVLLPETIDGYRLVAVTASHENVKLIDVAHNIVNHTCRICGYTDQCGESMYYSFESGVLTLYGSGDMYDYAYGKTPWISLRDQITEVVVGKDITSIGTSAFADCGNLERLVFETGSVLRGMDTGCFLRAGKLTDVVLPDTLNYVDVAFQGCTNATIYYPEAATVFMNSFVSSKGFITYKTVNGKKYITSPTESMLLVPEMLTYTGEELKSIALEQIGIRPYAEGITISGTNFGVDIDETKWVKSISESSVMAIGTYTAQYVGTYTYSGGSVAKVISKTFAVGKGIGRGTITLEGWTYGEAAKEPVPTSATNGTDSVTIKYKRKGEADSAYSDIKPSDAGEYIVQASFAENVNYSEAVATADFVIAKANQSELKITAVTGKKYGDGFITLETTEGTCTGSGGITYSVPDDNGILEIIGNQANISGAGKVTVTAAKAADVNYNSATATLEISIAKADAPILIPPTATGITYGQKLSDCILTSSSTQYGSFEWVNKESVPSVNAGTTVETVLFTPNAKTLQNYETIFGRFYDVSFFVNRATPSITVQVTVSGNTGSRRALLTAIVTGAGYGERPTGTVKFVNSSSGSDVELAGATAVIDANGKASFVWAGLTEDIYKVKAVYNGSGNYNTCISEAFEFDTHKKMQSALSIADIGIKTYGDNEFNLSTTGGNGVGVISFTSSDPAIVSITGSTVIIHRAGIVTITATKTEDDDYYEAIAATSLTVNKKELIVKADEKTNVIKGTAIPELTYSVTGLVGSDSFSGPTLNTTASDTNTTGEYDITISGGTLINTESYIITYIGSKLTIVNVPTPPSVNPPSGSAPNIITDVIQSDTGRKIRVDVNNKEDWEDAREQISQIRAGDTVTVVMNDSSVVPKEVFYDLSGKDVNVVFDLGKGITWSVNGKSITEEKLLDIDFGVELDSDAIPEELINRVSEDQTIRSISLSHDGKFGFTAVLSVNMGKKNVGRYTKLYYYNPTTKLLELQSVGRINEDGNTEFGFVHASEYVITTSTEDTLEKAMNLITINLTQRRLYVGGTQNKSVALKLEFPELLEKFIGNSGSDLAINYQSDNPKVATVTDSGIITAKKAGKTTITTTVTIGEDKKSFTTTIQVSKAYIKLAKSIPSMKKGSAFTFRAKGYGVNSSDIRFTTSKKSIIVINKTTGKATAETTGIDYVIAEIGNIKVKMKVKVFE